MLDVVYLAHRSKLFIPLLFVCLNDNLDGEIQPESLSCELITKLRIILITAQHQRRKQSERGRRKGLEELLLFSDVSRVYFNGNNFAKLHFHLERV